MLIMHRPPPLRSCPTNLSLYRCLYMYVCLPFFCPVFLIFISAYIGVSLLVSSSACVHLSLFVTLCHWLPACLTPSLSVSCFLPFLSSPPSLIDHLIPRHKRVSYNAKQSKAFINPDKCVYKDSAPVPCGEAVVLHTP